jgi:hypothetical protein
MHFSYNDLTPNTSQGLPPVKRTVKTKTRERINPFGQFEYVETNYLQPDQFRPHQPAMRDAHAGIHHHL